MCQNPTSDQIGYYNFLDIKLVKTMLKACYEVQLAINMHHWTSTHTKSLRFSFENMSNLIKSIGVCSFHKYRYIQLIGFI
jgi:hypothetical protein